MPLEESKSEGPTPCITFLGLELDSRTRTIRLPDDKLARLCQSLQEWGNIKATRKRNLLSLIGHLQHAAKVVRQGRSFLRCLIDLASMVNHLDGFIRLNVAARSDIMWWRTFAKHWNGTSMLRRQTPPPTHPCAYVAPPYQLPGWVVGDSTDGNQPASA